MRTILAYFKPWRWRLMATTSLGVAQVIVLLPIPFLLRYAFDTIIPSRNTLALVGIGGAMITLQCASALIAVRARTASLRIVKRVIRELRGAMLARWYEQPRRRYSAIEPAAMHDRIVHDIERVDVMVNAFVSLVFPAAILVLGVGTILLWLSPLLTFATVALVPVAMLVSHRIRRRMRVAAKTFIQTFESFSRGMWVAFESTDLTNIEAASSRQLVKHAATMDAVHDDGYRVAWTASAVTNTHNALTMVIGGVILVVGGLLLARGSLSLGDLLSFYGALALLRSSGNMALAALPQIMEGRAAAERLDAAMQDTITPEYTGTQAVALNGGVSLEDVVFGYDERRLLQDVDLALAAGDVVGISGDSGAGKTTIAMLMLGLYRPARGTVAFDGRPLADLDVGHVRRQIGMMPQDPLILPDSVLNNITFGLADDVEDRAARVAEAAALADLDEFVTALPQGYDTVLGTRGINLSGGQRQRIALARALVKRPRLLVLDEPTNHLGTSTITRVLDALDRWPSPPTVLIISHDPELLGHLPKVVHLSNGKLAIKRELARA
jgi:ABC-type bacteriocin/lantibiotic exporter with double-glycine peptidase domain